MFLFFLGIYSTFTIAQTATIKGKVFDDAGNPIENVSVSNGNTGTTTDKFGSYNLKISSGTNINILFSHISYNSYTKRVRIPKGKTLQFSPKLHFKTEKIDEVIIKDEKKNAEGITNIKTETISKLPSANNSIESVLKTLPGVNFNNELSTQYNVRGGSFDENLVYVNGIEVYRPFLIRSGQQEGLSFVNPNLTQNVDFSAGGFQAKYGDKLSSVLDITYKKPSQFGLAIEASLLGASVTVEGTSKNNKLKALVGARYRNNSLIVNSKDINSNYDPNFTDIQTYLSYEFNNKFTLDFLGSYALNNYNFTPISRQTNFGSILNPLALVVHY
ncbi:MAG: TonB-dependent receptor plug domain-containing protein, partial [Flavobacteriaceae bacterium]|nr:TonB-dependent receptor plug domain-containing protein [Flavobacteriaceae bacterium]